MRRIGMLTLSLMLVTVSIVLAQDHDLGLHIRKLDSVDMSEKTRATRMLGELGPVAVDAVPKLVKLLELADPGLRHEVVVALGKINSDPKDVIPALNRVLGDPLPALRLSAVDALRKFGSDAKESLEPLYRLLDDKEPLIAVSASRAILEIGNGKAAIDRRVQSVLIGGLKSHRQDVSVEAVHGLAVFGSQAVPAIVELLSDPDLGTGVNACNALAAIGPGANAAVDRLQVAAKSSEIQLRWHAIIALGDIGHAAKSAAPLLITALEDPDSHVRFSAAQSLHKIGKPAVPVLVEGLKKESLQHIVTPILSEIGPDAAEAVPGLAVLLSSAKAETRREAILALAGIGPAAHSTAEELTKILADKQFPYRPAAAFALGKIGAKQSIPTLKDAMQTPNQPTLHLVSVWALLQLEPSNEEFVKTALPLLTAALENEKPQFRREAAKALGRIGSRAKVSVPELKKSLSDKDFEVRRESMVALAEIGSDSANAVPEILQTLNAGEPMLRPIACYALGRIGASAKSALPTLQRLLLSHDPHEKTMAAWALVSISPDPETVKIAIPLLTAALARSENPEARAELARTLGKIGSNSTEVKAALTAALKDSDDRVRKAAELALSPSK